MISQRMYVKFFKILLYSFFAFFCRCGLPHVWYVFNFISLKVICSNRSNFVTLPHFKIFEIAAGDYLFYPEDDENHYYDVDDDHIAKILEILGPLPPERFRHGKRYNHLFNSRGNLHRIPKLAPAPLKKIITDLAELTDEQAEEMANFLKPMLHLDTRHRAKAADSLRSTWLDLVEICEMKRKRRDTLELV